jgi:predicted tellurium resistance membrane protein TerC
MDNLLALAADPNAWAALVTLIAMEVVLGIDNLVFIAILVNKLPDEYRDRTRIIGISLALVLRLVLLSTIAWLVHLTDPVLSLGGFDFSWRDLILIAGGLFLLWKATREIHENVDPNAAKHSEKPMTAAKASMGFASAVLQILLIDMIFSVDSILTAVGMTDQLPIMVVAVVIAVMAMMFASGPLAAFIHKNPTIVMLALGFLLMIGAMLIADGFGYHIPRGYIYAAMGFSALVETLNMMARKRRAALGELEHGAEPPASKPVSAASKSRPEA